MEIIKTLNVVNLTPSDFLLSSFSADFSETLDHRSQTVKLQRSGEASAPAA